MLDISVIVPTLNRARFLEPCLISMCQQNMDPARFEICVVNNNCTDNTPDVVAKVAALYPKHKLFMVHEPVPGLSRARNRGLASTSAALAANMDDDATVYPDWLERFVGRFEEFGSDLVTVSGEIEPIWETSRPNWLTDDMQQPLSAKTALGTQARFITQDEWLMEGNACYRRSALDAAGRYPENLGRVGNCLLSCEGTALAHRLRKNGGREFFDPKIILRHFIHANRLTPMWFRHRYFWQGVSDFATRQYNIKHDIAVKNEIAIDLPLHPHSWSFIAGDNAEKIEANLFQFQSLGFILAMTGILQIDGDLSGPDRTAPVLQRRHAFQQGVAQYAKTRKATGDQQIPRIDMPFDVANWSFIGKEDELSSEIVLYRLQSLGFVLASSGFIPVG